MNAYIKKATKTTGEVLSALHFFLAQITIFPTYGSNGSAVSIGYQFQGKLVVHRTILINEAYTENKNIPEPH